jgi:hypothetical protein
MKKRILAAALAGCMLASMLGTTASAASTNAALQTVQSLGVITADASGSLNLNAAVTRAQFAQMLATLSGKATGSVSGALFSDVSGSSAAAGAIRLAVQEGWMNGYADGSFRPDKTITLEEACTAALRVLGYDTAKLSGAFPAAQLEKASELGLRQDITLTQGQGMTRAACVSLLYNMLVANTAGGGTYASTLGYTVTTGGEVDYTAALVQGMSGPYIAASGAALPFTPAVIYRDGKQSTSAALQLYDVYYYNEAQKTAWIYTKRIAGRVSALTPNAKTPTTVSVAGYTYEIGSANAVYQLSVLSGGGVGSVVTLLLGMDDQVVGVVTGSQVDATYYGVVQSVGRSVETDGGAKVLQSMEVLCTDGILHTFEVDQALLYPEGWIVEVDVTADGVAVQPLANTVTGSALRGTVNAAATALGQYAFEDNIKILDTTTEGAGVAIQPSRLAGCTLGANDVRFYSLDADGKIDHLILNDVTGDVWTYGYLTNVGLDLEAKTSGESFWEQLGSKAKSILQSIFGNVTADNEETRTAAQVNLAGDILDSVEHGSIASDLWSNLTKGTLDLGSAVVSSVLSAAAGGAGGSSTPVGYLLSVLANGAQYTYLVDGAARGTSSSIPYSVVAGGIAVRYSTSGDVKAMLQTTPIVVEKLGANTATAGGKTYTLADEVQVYLYKYGEYYSVALSDVNAEDYILTGWYDDFGCTAGGRVRILVAVRK